jgi:hypothetical protein
MTDKQRRTQQAVSLQIVVLLMVWLSAAPSRAEEGAPPVLDPADVFTDAVEVVETLPILNVDPRTRKLWYFDPSEETWREYDYPIEVADVEVLHTARRSDGTFVIGDAVLNSNEEGYWTPSPEHVWIFNPSEEEVTSPKVACGRIQDLQGEGRWVVYQRAEDNLYYLCFTETGDIREPLPEVVQTKLCNLADDIYWRLPSPSPDGNWLVFTECNTQDLYAVELATGQTNYLGMLEQTPITFIDQWIDATAFTLRANTRSPESRYSVYIADLAEPESLELIATQYANSPRYYDNSPRYIWDGNATSLLESGQVGRQEIYEYNLETRERSVLVHEPCDSISPENLSISICSPSRAFPANSRYIAVLSTLPQQWYELVTVFDLESGEIVYDNIASSPAYFVWEDEDTFSYYGGIGDEREFLTHIVTITEQGFRDSAAIRPLPYSPSPINTSTGKNLWLANDPRSLLISIYDFEAGQNIPIFQDVNRQQFLFEGYWQSDGTLQITVTNELRYFAFGAWIVRIS